MRDSLRKKLMNKINDIHYQYDKMKELKDKGWIKEDCDLYGTGKPNLVFPFMLNRYAFLLDDNDVGSFSKKSINKVKRINYIVRKFGHFGLKTKQVFEDREALLNLPKGSLGDVIIPDEPVIFVSNHFFRDDILGTMIATDRTAYALCGSLPLFFNTLDGILIHKSGAILINRKVKSNKRASIEKQKLLLKNGCSLIVYPEGVWNKSPNKLVLPLWNGVFKLAKETGVKIVPIVHHINDPAYITAKKNNDFHTVVDNPIDPNFYSEEELKQIIEEKFSTWVYIMIEKYGKTTRGELLANFADSQSAWEYMLQERIKTTHKYDLEVETKSDFRPKDIIPPEDVFLPIANLNITSKNLNDVEYAKHLIKEQKRNDFQHRF